MRRTPRTSVACCPSADCACNTIVYVPSGTLSPTLNTNDCFPAGFSSLKSWVIVRPVESTSSAVTVAAAERV